MTITVIPLTDALGAEVSGVDLAGEIEPRRLHRTKAAGD